MSNPFSINISLLSKYRTELMGCAIIGVLIAHILLYTGTYVPVIHHVIRFVYTPGFLLLSGFGLYYSFSKSPKISLFYKKRLNRLYIPFVIISFPFLILFNIVNDGYLFDFLLDVTTIRFWISGNYLGLWYVAVSLILYLLYPFMHGFIFSSDKQVISRGLILFSCYCFVLFCIYLFLPGIWLYLGEWIRKTPMFVIGILLGYLTNKSICINKYLFLFILIIGLLLFYYGKKEDNPFFLDYARTIIGIPFVLFMFYIMDYLNLTRLIFLFKWFGTYSLELYLLHLLFYWLAQTFWDTSIFNRIIVSVIISILLCKPYSIIIEKVLGLINKK